MRRLLLPLTAVVALGLGAAGCGGEEPPPYDDGSQGVPLAGLGPQLDAAGVDVVVAGSPEAATVGEVVSALGEAGLSDVTSSAPADLDARFGIDGGATAGLLGAVSPGGGSKVVVLAFTSPAAAAVFAADLPEGVADAERRPALLAGNLVASTPAADLDAVRRALDALAGTESPSGSPTESPTESPSA